MGQGAQSHGLDEVGGRNKQVLLETDQRTDRADRCDDVAQPEPGHRVALGKSIEHETLVRHPKRRGIGDTVVQESVVHLIRQHRHPKLGQRAHHLWRLHGAGGVGGRGNQDPLRPRGHRRPHPLDVDLIAIDGQRGDEHTTPAAHLDHVGITRVVRGRHDDLVPGVQQQVEDEQQGRR